MIYRITNDGHKYAHLVKNHEELMALRNSKENLENLAKARKGDAEAKAHLVQFAYNLGHVDGALAGCKSIGSYFFHDIDCYENGNANGNVNDNSQLSPDNSELSTDSKLSTLNSQLQEEMVKHILAKKEEIGLMMLERSASGGYHLVCKRVPGTTILENQVRIATILQIEMDTSTKDLQRVVFSTSGSPEDLIYLDDELFTEPMTPEECVQEYNHLKVRVMQRKENVPAGAKKANKHYKPWEEDPLTPFRGNSSRPEVKSEESKLPDCQLPLKGDGGSLSFRGIKYCEIIRKWWEMHGGEPQEGERNVKLYQLAVNLRAICDNKKEILLQTMPRLGLDEQEFRSIIDSACKEPPKGISRQMKEVLLSLEDKDTASSPSGEVGRGAGISSQMNDWGSQIEALSEHFPILKDICKGLKKNQYPAALFVGGGLLMTLMTRCTYRFYHRPEERRRLNNSTLIIGDPASGKSFATRLYKLLAEPIVKADEEGKKAINAYRELIKSKGCQQGQASEAEGGGEGASCQNLERSVHTGHGECRGECGR